MLPTHSEPGAGSGSMPTWSGLQSAAEEVLGAAGFAPRHWAHIGTLARPGQRRAAFRVELVDGRTIKVRCHADERTARRQELVQKGLGDVPGLAPLLHRRGRVVIEAWIDGASPSDDHPETLSSAAELLARIHGTRAFGRRRLPMVRPAARWRRAAVRQVEALGAAGVIGAAAMRALLGALDRLEPATTEVGVTHGDFCLENLALGRDGRLHAIDNEAMRIDSLDADLGRVWYRWPMADARFDAFVEAYERRTGRRFDHRDFWRTVGVIRGAFVRSKYRLPGAAEVAVRLARHADALARDTAWGGGAGHG